jgi:hypothetical protein
VPSDVSTQRVNFLPDLVAVSALVLATVALSSLALRRITSGFSNDIIPHAQLAVQYLESGNLFTYSLWYPLIWVATAGGDPALFRAASIVLLVGFVVVKAVVAYFIANSIRRQAWSSALIAFGVTFFGPLVDPDALTDIYLGQIAPTVWHNSTNIAVAPFALLAFWAAMRLVSELRWRPALLAGIAAALAIAMKPNFGLAMIPVLGIAVLVGLIRMRAGWRLGSAVVAAAALPALAVLAAQFASVYGGGLDRDESLTVAPFAAWLLASDNIAWSIVLSLFGVAVVLIVLLVRREQTRELLLAWAVLGVALTQMSLFAEMLPDGSIAESGNWFWGAYTALMVVTLYSATAVRDAIAKADTARWQMLPIVAAVALGAHVIAGLYYTVSVGTPAYGSF